MIKKSGNEEVLIQTTRVRKADGIESVLFMAVSKENERVLGTGRAFILKDLFAQKTHLQEMENFSYSCSELAPFLEEIERRCFSYRPTIKNLVFLDEILVDKDFQGSGIGSKILAHMLSALTSNFSVFALEACPIDSSYDDLEDADIRRQRQRQGIDRLHSWYERYGFERIQDSDYRFMITSDRNLP